LPLAISFPFLATDFSELIYYKFAPEATMRFKNYQDIEACPELAEGTQRF